MKVLIAEGHQGIREALCASLSGCGIQVVAVAADGFEAVEKARMLTPDFVILDFHMPRCGGLEAASAIRTATPLAKIILLTTWDEEVYARAAAGCGAIACFPKDVATRDLISAMEIGQRREAQSLADIPRAPASGAREREGR